MKIHEYFNPHDKEHLRAYRELQETGTWPKGFVPEGTTFSTAWQSVIASMMANCWVSHVLDKEHYEEN